MSQVSKLGNENDFNKILDNILIPRVVGSEGHKQVNSFIKRSLVELGWTVETDRFEDTTPNLGTLTFENIYATLNPNAEKYLVLACHYDSKYFLNEEFLGATDSAVPCSMLIHMAQVLQNVLVKNLENNSITLRLLFFDGEEAFETWTKTDSIYGARHLADKWEKDGELAKIVGNRAAIVYKTIHIKITLFVLETVGPSRFIGCTRSKFLQFLPRHRR